MPPRPPLRGRPPQVDPHELSLVALRLFERDGFDQVTMDDVARAASVSRRTLFRLFPSKADLVWHGLDEVLAGLQERTAKVARSRASLDVLMDQVFAAGLAQLDDPKAARLARRRLRLIGASPALLGHQTLAAIQDVLTAMVAARSTKGDPPPALVARAFFAVAFASVLWWVEHEDSMPVREALRAALGALPHTSPRSIRRRNPT